MKGPRYKDREAAEDGIRKLTTKSGPEAKGKLALSAKNAANKGRTALATGLSAALAGNAAATVQVRTSDAGCFGATLSDVRRSDPDRFQAK